jgi:hypothetical protein
MHTAHLHVGRNATRNHSDSDFTRICSWFILGYVHVWSLWYAVHEEYDTLLLNLPHIAIRRASPQHARSSYHRSVGRASAWVQL